LKFFQSWRFVAAAVLIAVTLPWTIGAARRNRAYLHLLRGEASDAAYSADDLFVLRSSLERGDWATAGQMLARTARPDRLAPLLVLHEADRRVKARDIAGGRAALALVSAQAGSDPALWYRLGEIYERAAAAKDAVSAYARGTVFDPAGPWTYGRHIDTSQLGGAIWQEALLPLGHAYEQLGRAADAEATYERVSRIEAPRRDWTLNRALVSLSGVKRAQGDVPSALEAVRRALDVATELDVSYRRTYELDTSAEAERVVDQARREGRAHTLRAGTDGLVLRAPDSPGAWYLRGLTSEAACDLAGARSDYGRASALVRPGSGAFLTGRPADPPRGGCPSR
jgi:tetratricopeptide (TPR) repeat protein